MNPQVILPVATLVIGALLGLLSTVVASRLSHHRTIELRLLDQFLEVRKQVVDAISDLTSIDIHAPLDAERRTGYAHSVSKLFYQHYDFLPRQVLDALVLLEVCLSRPERGPYALRDDMILPMEESELVLFIESCSVFAHARLFAPLALKSNDAIVRQKEAIRLHARHVLQSLNTFASIEDLLAITKTLKKVPGR